MKKQIAALMASLMCMGAVTAVSPATIVKPVSAYAISQSQQNFMENVAKPAMAHYPDYKILPSMTIAQAILESAWGTSNLAKNNYNFFGMKKNGKYIKFNSFDDGIEGYYKFITENKRYSNLVGETDYKEACRKIKADGWAEDPSYATKLINLIEKYNLTKYDVIPDPLPFIDVHPNDWFANAVRFVYKNNIMKGTSSTTFSPYALLTREQFVTVIFNMADDKEKNNIIYQNFFTDVQDGNWYTKPVMWAYCWGITSGYGSTFGIGDNITREQMAVMLYNYAQKFKKINCSSSTDLSAYPDNGSVSNYAIDAMKWAVGNGIISGTKDINGRTILAPQSNETRAECAQVVWNFAKKYGK